VFQDGNGAGFGVATLIPTHAMRQPQTGARYLASPCFLSQLLADFY
jgi:hypothetical protein